LNVVDIHVIGILDIIANDACIGLSCNFVGDENKTSMIWADEINSNIKFDVSE